MSLWIRRRMGMWSDLFFFFLSFPLLFWRGRGFFIFIFLVLDFVTSLSPALSISLYFKSWEEISSSSTYI